MKTYSHLAGNKRIPSEYDIASTKLHYYPDRGFEVNMPIADWYAKYQADSPFKAKDWDRFADPRQTTYSQYTKLQAPKENFVIGVFQSMENQNYDNRLNEKWLKTYERIFTPLRYPCHGLQMAAAYVGHMAPASRITIAAAFQASDEIRRIQWLAYRMAMIEETKPGFGHNAKQEWQEAPLWQPLRKLIETLLVTFDWGEAFVALNFGIKPLFDRIFMEHFARLAQTQGDYLLPEVLESLNEDCKWHQEWSMALIEVLEEENDKDVREAIHKWEEKWRLLADEAMRPFLTAGTEGSVP